MSMFIRWSESGYHMGTMEWHVGETIPDLRVSDGTFWVQADSDELNFIKRHITGLPMRDASVVRWYGDHAKFIVGNL